MEAAGFIQFSQGTWGFACSSSSWAYFKFITKCIPPSYFLAALLCDSRSGELWPCSKRIVAPSPAIYKQDDLQQSHLDFLTSVS